MVAEMTFRQIEYTAMVLIFLGCSYPSYFCSHTAFDDQRMYYPLGFSIPFSAVCLTTTMPPYHVGNGELFFRARLPTH